MPASVSPGLPTYTTPKVEVASALTVHFSLVYATPCAPNLNGTCHLQLMALLTALLAADYYVNRY